MASPFFISIYCDALFPNKFMLTVYKYNNSHCLNNSLIHSEVTTFIVPVIFLGKTTHQTVCRVYVTTWEPTTTDFNHPPRWVRMRVK